MKLGVKELIKLCIYCWGHPLLYTFSGSVAVWMLLSGNLQQDEHQWSGVGVEEGKVDAQRLLCCGGGVELWWRSRASCAPSLVCCMLAYQPRSAPLDEQQYSVACPLFSHTFTYVDTQ
jgi:hypothetical protein